VNDNKYRKSRFPAVLKTKIKGNGSVWVESGIVLVLRYGVGILAALQGGRACV
jgi:hypothetical protein